VRAIAEVLERVAVNLAAQEGSVGCPPGLSRGLLIAIVVSVPMWAAMIGAFIIVA
jgi:hypothetical protein